MTSNISRIHAEISIVALSNESGTSMSKEIAAAYKAMRNIKDLTINLTPMGTQIEAKNLQLILKAIEAAHQAAKDVGALRIISNIRIDERLDKDANSDDRTRSVMQKV